ncbi:hypothetical protein [Streptomyces sp. WM6378]|nr:hypothetical protein [Streptomyces sp. WM6378]
MRSRTPERGTVTAGRVSARADTGGAARTFAAAIPHDVSVSWVR